MSSIPKRLEKILFHIESAPTSFLLWFGAFFSIIFARLLVESWVAGFSGRSIEFLFAEFTHTFLFFLLSYVLFTWLLSVATKTPVIRVSNVLLWGFLIILTPPIIDFVISHGEGYWSFYKFDGIAGLWERFLTFFGDRPEVGITYGVRVEVAIALAGFFLYLLTKTKHLVRAVLWTALAYIFFFILGTFPSYITILLDGFSKGFFTVTAPDVAQMFLTPERVLSQNAFDLISVLNQKMSLVYALVLSALIPLLGFFFFKKYTLALLRNARLPQSLYHGGLVCVGAGLAILFSDKPFSPSLFDILAFLLLLVSVECAWLASVVVNDLFDTRIDALTNTQRPLVQHVFSQEHYRTIGWIFFLCSLLFSAVAFPPAVIFLLFYQALAFLYSAHPLRLKRIPVVATFVSAVASILLFLLGYIALHPTGSLANLPANIIVFLLFAYTVSLPIKDFKDIKGDREDTVCTIPVLFGETKGRLIVASGIFLSFVLSVPVLNDSSLTLWAVFFGASAFWTVATSHKWTRLKITPRQLPLALLAFVIAYGIVIVSVFLKTQ